MADTSLSSEPIPAGGRRILIVSAATLGFQCLIALGICLFGAAIAAVEASGDMSAERAMDILVVFTQVYAEVVGVFSAFPLLLIIFVVEYAVRHGDEPRQPPAFWRGISVIASWSGIVATTNVAIYLLMVGIGRDSDNWHLSPTALMFLLVSVLALVASVWAAACARRALRARPAR